MKASNDEVKLSLYHGNNKVTLNSESKDATCIDILCEPANSHGIHDFTTGPLTIGAVP